MLKSAPLYSYVPASDMERARQFYEDKLGLIFQCAGGTGFFMYPTPNAGTNEASCAFWQVDDIKATVAWAVLLVPGFNVVLLAQLAGGQSRAAALAVVAGMTTATLVWHTSLAVAFSQEAVQRAYLRNFAHLNKVSGAVVGAFGLRLIVGTLQELRARMP